MTGRARGKMGNHLLRARNLPDGLGGRRGRFAGGGRAMVGEPANDNVASVRYRIGRAMRLVWITALLAGLAAGFVQLLS